MVFGLRTLAKGVRGGACAVGGVLKAVAGVAVGGAGTVINLAKAAVSGDPKAQTEGNQVFAPQPSQEEAMRRQLLLSALLLVSLTQAPQLLLPGVLGAAATKAFLAANENKGRMAESRSDAKEEKPVADSTVAALSGGVSGLPAVEAQNAGRGNAECGDGYLEEGASKARVSVSDKGDLRRRSEQQLGTLMRSVSDSAVSAREIVTDGDCDITGSPLAEQVLNGDSQVREVVAEVEQGEKKEGSVCGGVEEGEVTPRKQETVALPEECTEHAPHGLCVGCFAFNGTAEDLLEWHKEESNGKPLPEYLVLPILKHAANILQAMHLRGMCVGSLSPANILLTNFPLMGRPITLEHVHLLCECFEIPATALPLRVGAKNVASLGVAITELLGGFPSTENKERWARLTPLTVDILQGMVQGDRWGLTRPTAAELGSLLEQHPVLLVA